MRPDPSGGVQESLLTTANGVILNAMPAAGGGKGYTHRQNMTVYASTSGGATWYVRRRVYAGPVGYSSLGELSTGTTYVASSPARCAKTNLLLCRRSILAYERELAGCLGESCCIQWTPT